jgi:hypothetical protein
MSNATHRLATLGLLTLFVTSGLRASDCPINFDVAATVAMFDARNRAQLEELYRSRSYPDRVADIVYAVRRSAITGKHVDDLTFRAIPRNPSEFWSAYRLSDPRIASVRPRLAELFDDYLATLETAISKPSVSTELMRRYLLLTVFSDGAIAESLAEANIRVSKANPHVFRAAVQQLKPAERKRICGRAGPCSQPATP